MAIITKDLKRRLEDLADSFAITTGENSKDAKEKAKAKAEAKKKKRKEQRRLLDRDSRGLKERLKDYAKGSDNYSRMSDLDGEHINYRDMHKVRNKKVKKGDK